MANDSLNALVVPLFERARAEAVEADRRRERGERLGLLHGVPVTVKECFHVAGTPSTIGLTHCREPLDEDGVLVRRLRAAGAIIIGKTNVPQLMLWHESDNPVYGRTNNPWDLERSPGGSTGGEAALIAAGGSPLGLGSDLGGSIRLPCHFCGIHGLKPTSFRLPRRGMRGNLHGFEAIVLQPGPMARRVEDLELAMRVLTQETPDARNDPDMPPVAWPDWHGVSIRGLRVGVMEDDGYFRPVPAVRRLVREAAESLAQQGAIVETYEPDGTRELVELYMALAGADGGADARRMLRGSEVDPRLKRMAWLAGLNRPTRMMLAKSLRMRGQHMLADMLSSLGPLSADRYWQLTERMSSAVRRIEKKWHQHGFDVLLMPPHGLPAMPHRKPIDLLAAASYAFVPNLLGWPAGVVSLSRVRLGEESDRPASRDLVIRRAIESETGSAGLPIGVQVLAPAWREHVVLGVMAALEQAFETDADFPAGRCSVN
ncbi:MAG: amidase [Planctomycetales bacterium]|nr:amidase [Planctomycetales bacterium]